MTSSCCTRPTCTIGSSSCCPGSSTSSARNCSVLCSPKSSGCWTSSGRTGTATLLSRASAQYELPLMCQSTNFRFFVSLPGTSPPNVLPFPDEPIERLLYWPEFYTCSFVRSGGGLEPTLVAQLFCAFVRSFYRSFVRLLVVHAPPLFSYPGIRSRTTCSSASSRDSSPTKRKPRT